MGAFEADSCSSRWVSGAELESRGRGAYVQGAVGCFGWERFEGKCAQDVFRSFRPEVDPTCLGCVTLLADLASGLEFIRDAAKRRQVEAF